jgi:double-strand break repair protein MRE11
VTNLVNYFGRQEEVDQIEISPILFQKGTTRIALYGLGSLRDERLNRMWEKQKVIFLRPDGEDEEDDLHDDDDDDDDDEDNRNKGFFNIFALHQNRDLGRGTKNCVQERMIPEWMDVVVWVGSIY